MNQFCFDLPFVSYFPSIDPMPQGGNQPSLLKQLRELDVLMLRTYSLRLESEEAGPQPA
jgi:hypothetical protein